MLDVPLDVCALAPPEPMERVLDALCALAPDARLAVLIDRQPHPLLRILDRNGYRHQLTARSDRRFDLLIWRAA